MVAGKYSPVGEKVKQSLPNTFLSVLLLWLCMYIQHSARKMISRPSWDGFLVAPIAVVGHSISYREAWPYKCL
jgi:hypothetical protein